MKVLLQVVKIIGVELSIVLLIIGCSGNTKKSTEPDMAIKERLNRYSQVSLTTDLSTLTDNERKMLPLLIEASKAMDDVFWKEAYGDKDSLLSRLPDEAARSYVEINYGPWDRLDNNRSFIEGIGEKPKGANFYPQDMTREEFESQESDTLKSLYTLVRRNADGSLYAIPYHVAFAKEHELAARKLRQAARYADDPGLKNYLTLRAEALLTDHYQPSDLAWLDMKNNNIDIVIGPIETYEDQRYGYKASHEAYVLIKDKEWSKRLEKYAAMLPDLQKALPVPEELKREKPGTDSDLNVYDVVYYAGDCNAGSKTIAINLPNDEQVQIRKGTRRLQLKNAMKAKFDKIMVPVANELIAPDQRKHVTFDAFFDNTMFHEVAHGLGIKSTINGKGTVRSALKEEASALEEGKADILGLFMVTKLIEEGELTNASLEDHYVTFLAGIFRSVRFGASSAHGRANMLRFNYFKEMNAFTRDPETGTYRVNFDKMKTAMDSLSLKILTLQGTGDYAGVKELMKEKAAIGPQLQKDLDRLSNANIPVDIVFKQGPSVLGI